jgi:hypothetical protein
MNKILSDSLNSTNSFFYNLTGLFSKDITFGTKEVDEAISHSLFKINKTLEIKTPFPTIVESQGNVFEYEDFPRSRIDSELLEATNKLINFGILKERK